MNTIRRPHLTIRSRLTLTYAALVAGSGTILVAVVWAFMTFVPQYSAVSFNSADASPPSLLENPTGTPPFIPLDGTGATTQSGVISVSTATGFLNLLLTVSTVVLIAVVILSALTGWIVAGRVLRPLKAINHAATVATTGALDHRVELDGPHDEIHDLGDTFNRMLTALEKSFETEKRFAANASHELRTPLATIQTMIDVALADPHLNATALRHLAERIHTINRDNADTVTALLDLANTGRASIKLQPVRLDSLTSDAIRTVTGEAESRNISILNHPPATIGDETTVPGDPVLLRQCLTNLLQNAVRHNTDGGTINIHTRNHQQSAISLIISNTGTLLPAEITKSLAEPFVRGAGRTTTPGRPRGHGLGLTIATKIAETHHGHLTLRPNPEGGLTATLQLPRTTNGTIS